MNRRKFDWPLVNESSRNEIKQIVTKIWTAAQVLYFSYFKGYPVFYFATIHLREVSQYPWLVTGVFFHMYETLGPYVMESMRPEISVSCNEVFNGLPVFEIKLFFNQSWDSYFVIFSLFEHIMYLIMKSSKALVRSKYWPISKAMSVAFHFRGWSVSLSLLCSLLLADECKDAKDGTMLKVNESFNLNVS